MALVEQWKQRLLGQVEYATAVTLDDFLTDLAQHEQVAAIASSPSESTNTLFLCITLSCLS
jgi:hypothetical protein